DRAEVTMLLPPGMEPHSFEPRPEDIVRLHKADLFIYTNPAMEPWAAGLVKGAAAANLTVVDASRGARLLKMAGEGDHGVEKGEHYGGIDPHLWLDFANARVMVANIAAALEARDPANRAYYRANAVAYEAKLADLDERYRVGLATCAKRTFLHGGHYAFGYLAHRYGLHYESAYAAGAEAEPTPAKLAELVQKIRQEGLKVIYTEELLDPRTAETIARETGATVLMLNGAHTIGRDDLARGVTFLSLMERNLQNLRMGLQCR
ncbi:zinc ABC transporter substrate-binding protein, partial [Geobacter sp.]|uniref:metal ABC transporter solute-binding protein, Zn/Mn family n=1 Tax=Geobacter sp. TaxID=46610 RepID=UPI002619FB05